MAQWTQEVLAWSGETSVLLGLPAYDDAESGYHHPEAENLEHALRGIHAAMHRDGVAENYEGVAIYSDWEMDEGEWETFRKLFRKR